MKNLLCRRKSCR